jgi:serine/threonine-protein kinase HipA
MNVDRCPSTLKTGFASYSPAALRKLFQNKKVSHILPFASPENDEKVKEAFLENRKRLSISGVQVKLSLKLDKNKLRLTTEGERGHYILKPIPVDLLKVEQLPANEHLTMQIAEQVFNLNTAANALIFFKDDRPAYITRRFDYKPDGTKRSMEDFATLAGKTKDSEGDDFKYEASCEYLFILLRRFVGPYIVEAQKLFKLVLFNYAFSNGDAHLKNFSLLETDSGDSILSPAYDLVCSRIHVGDSDLAFKHGLFSDDFETESYKANAFYAYDDFHALGLRAGLPVTVVEQEINQFGVKEEEVKDFINRSFLNEEVKELYLNEFLSKLKRLRYSFNVLKNQN